MYDLLPPPYNAPRCQTKFTAIAVLYFSWLSESQIKFTMIAVLYFSWFSTLVWQCKICQDYCLCEECKIIEMNEIHCKEFKHVHLNIYKESLFFKCGVQCISVWLLNNELCKWTLEYLTFFNSDKIYWLINNVHFCVELASICFI